MKRSNQFNISTSSFRSSSSRRSRRKTNNSNSNSNSNSTSNQSSIKINASNNGRIIGNSSKKSFHCKGCNNTFKLYSSVTMFINQHVKSNEKCPQAFPKCLACGKIFYEESYLLTHTSRSGKNSKCYSQYIQHKVNTKYSSSEVKIPAINKNTYLPSHIPEHLNPLYSIEKNMMVSKINSDYTSFHDTVKFQNMNIHNFKNDMPSNFQGHASIDPKSLALRKDVASSGIYCKPRETLPISSKVSNKASHKLDNLSRTTPNLNLKKSSHHQQEQVIDFGDFSNDFQNDSNSTNSRISVSSLEKYDNSSISSKSDDSNSHIVTNATYNLSNNILQSIIEEQDNDSIISVHSSNTTNKCSASNEPNNDLHSDTVLHIHADLCPNQQSVEINDSDHFMKMKSLQSREISNGICDTDYKECLELVTILMKYNVPTNGIYDELIKWKNKNSKLTSSTLSIQSLISRAKIRVHGQSISTKLSPIKTNLTCPSGRRVTVTSFDADAIIYELLSDNNLMQSNNLVFEDGNIDNPFYMKESEYYSDFHTSEFYKETMKMKEINPDTDLLVPIQLYMDETILDSYKTNTKKN